MFSSRTQMTETRSVYMLGKGCNEFSIEVVRKFTDLIADDGVLLQRRMTSIHVEGDIPSIVKKCVEACLRRGALDEAKKWLTDYAGTAT